MILIKNADGSYTESGDNSITNNLLDGAKAPFLKENEFLSSKAAFWGTVLYTGLGTGVGSSVARKRQAEGKAPVAKFFF